MMNENEDITMEVPTPQKESFRQNDYRSVVPWRIPKDFRKVYQCLYSASLDDKIWATDEIAVWETRCQYSLPTAIEATHVLVRAAIQDMLEEHIIHFHTREKDLQNLYSMAIVRFVNLMIEKEGKEKNLSILADKHNIPRWVVELRHDASHAKLPSLPLLRMGAKLALQYLEEVYWMVESERVCSHMKTSKSLEVALALINQYKVLQFETKGKKVNNNSPKGRIHQKALKRIRSFVRNNKQKFVEALVTPGVFLCEKEIQLLEKSKEAKIYVENNKIKQFPEKFIEFWLPVLKILHTYELILTFIELLLLSLEQIPSTVCHSTAALVVVYLLRAAMPKDSETQLGMRFKAKGVILDSSRLLYVSMRAANQITGHVFNEIVENYFDDSELLESLTLALCPRQGLIAYPCKEVPAALKEEDTLVFTVDDMDKDIREDIAKKTDTLVESKWSLAPLSINFSEMALGALINPVEPSSEDPMDEEKIDVEEYLIEDDDQSVQGEENEFDFNEPEIGDMLYGRYMNKKAS